MSGPSFPQFSTNELSMRSIRKLRLHQLQVVDSILQTGSFVQAAQQLGMTQSAITKAVQELEAFFDGQLFVRSRRGAQATELGAQLGGHIRPILRKVQDMADALNDYRLGESGSLVVGVLSTASSDRFTEAVRLLHQQYPRINISVLVGDRSQLHAYLLSGRVDIILGSMPGLQITLPPELEAVPLYEDSMAVMAAKDHPLATYEQVSLQTLQAFPWILPATESVVRARLDQFFAENGVELPQDCIASLSPLLTIGLLSDQRSVAFMAAGLVAMLAPEGAWVRLPVVLPVSFGQIGYVVVAGKSATFAVERFIECLLHAA
ncbi:MAG: LysR family transcriptional regulator [Pigmentiphaga sp.]